MSEPSLSTDDFDFPWIEHDGNGLPLPPETLIHCLTTFDRRAEFCITAGKVKPEAWTLDGFECSDGSRHRITHYVLAG